MSDETTTTVSAPEEKASREDLITLIDFLLEEIQRLDAHKQWLAPTPDYSIIALAEHIVAQG